MRVPGRKVLLISMDMNRYNMSSRAFFRILFLHLMDAYLEIIEIVDHRFVFKSAEVTICIFSCNSCILSRKRPEKFKLWKMQFSNRGVADKLAENLLLSYQCDSGVSSSAVTKIYFPLEFYMHIYPF